MVDYFGRRTENLESIEYKAFINENLKKVNLYLNSVLWACILVGPAIAGGIKLGIFDSVQYITCITISLVMFVMSVVHYEILRRRPESILPSIIALVAIELLLMRMELSYINIHITWFFVPILSIMLCNRKVYLATLAFNYIIMDIAVWLVSPHYASVNTNYNTATSYFFNTISGYTIEMIVISIVGYALTKINESYFKDLIEKNLERSQQIDKINAQMDILNSMVGIYEYANLIDFNKMTEMSLLDNNYEIHKLDLLSQTHTRMNNMLLSKVAPDQHDMFYKFTDIRTVQQRLTNKKVIYNEFIGVEMGWFRAQYISVEADKEGVPYIVVYTIQNIDTEKRREEHLIRISITDELTRLYNRRSFEDSIAKYNTEPLEDNFVIACMDVNRLKFANDTKGHAAGDELIVGAANCLFEAVGNRGTVYRTGGDEFTAILFTEHIETIVGRIREIESKWKGEYMDSLSISVGYAAHKDYPDADLKELEKIADAVMYEDKTRYYKENGFERRRYN